MRKIIALSALCIVLAALSIPIGYFVLEGQQNIDDISSNPEGTVSYLVNLDRSEGRRKYVMPSVKALAYPVQIVSAVDGKYLSDDEINQTTDIDAYEHSSNYYPSKGTIGCYLSHIKVWREFLNSDYKFAVIFEDDVSFDPVKLKSVIEQLQANAEYWDINSFEISHRGNPLTLKKLVDNYKLVVYSYKVSHSGAYIINRKAAKQLLEKSLPIRMPVDHYFTRSWELDLKFTGVEPRLVHQSYGDSVISQMKELNNNKEVTTLYLFVYRGVFNIQTHIINYLHNWKIYLKYKYS
ncbi:MAG: glycosyltransferase family 25 protein [Janthinobacterium lividum]